MLDRRCFGTWLLSGIAREVRRGGSRKVKTISRKTERQSSATKISKTDEDNLSLPIQEKMDFVTGVYMTVE